MMKTVEKDKPDVSESAEVIQTLNEAEAIISQVNISKTKKPKIFLIVSLVLLSILILVFSTIFSLLTMHSDTIVQGVSIYGVDVSGLTKQEADSTLKEYIAAKEEKPITLIHNDFSASISLSQLNIKFDFSHAIEEAYSIGRNGQFFQNNFQVFHTMFQPINITPDLLQDDNIIDELATSLNQNFSDSYVNPSYYIDNLNLIITSGKNGITTDSNALLRSLLLSFQHDLESEIVIDIPVRKVTAKKIDIDSIYQETYKAPSDAYYLTDPYVVYPSSTGLDFAISVDEAKNMLLTPQEEYHIPLKTLYPNVSTNDIGMEAFPDLLAEFSTSFQTSNYSRSTNITLASSKINGIVLMPGETFSYNQSVGQRTRAAGFQEAPAYLNGQVVQEVGGGICQVSSTLYNAVLYANLEIVERKNHTFKPTYVKPGLDATVSWGGPDFKFKNNRDYPIRIVTDTSNKIVHTYIYGLKRDTDYIVQLEANYLSTVYPKTVQKYSSSLATGEQRVISSGSTGCKTVSYKILYDQSGNFITKEQISSDVYSAHEKVVEVGR